MRHLTRFSVVFSSGLFPPLFLAELHRKFGHVSINSLPIDFLGGKRNAPRRLFSENSLPHNNYQSTAKKGKLNGDKQRYCLRRNNANERRWKPTGPP
jgi:hypothetical protein